MFILFLAFNVGGVRFLVNVESTMDDLPPSTVCPADYYPAVFNDTVTYKEVIAEMIAANVPDGEK